MYSLFYSLQSSSAAITNICDLSWLWVILGLLIPFLLGLLLGWAIWARWKKIAAEWEAKANKLRTEKTKLTSDLDACKRRRSELEGENSRKQSEIRELKLRLDEEAKANMKLAEAAKKAKAVPPVQSSTTPPAQSAVSAASGFAAGAAMSGNKGNDITDESLAEAKAVFGKRIKADDLKIVEGIGPKIEQLFKDAGIKTWYMLSKTDPADLKKILDDAGPRFLMHVPRTWPRQAQMAYEGRWAELLKYQDELDGGK